MQEIEQVAPSCQYIYENRKYRVKVEQGVGVGERVHQRKHKQMKILGKGTWIWEQAEHPWTGSAVVNYVEVIYLELNINQAVESETQLQTP